MTLYLCAQFVHLVHSCKASDAWPTGTLHFRLLQPSQRRGLRHAFLDLRVRVLGLIKYGCFYNRQLQGIERVGVLRFVANIPGRVVLLVTSRVLHKKRYVMRRDISVTLEEPKQSPLDKLLHQTKRQSVAPSSACCIVHLWASSVCLGCPLAVVWLGDYC
jgi:hypothetical protein